MALYRNAVHVFPSATSLPFCFLLLYLFFSARPRGYLDTTRRHGRTRFSSPCSVNRISSDHGTKTDSQRFILFNGVGVVSRGWYRVVLASLWRSLKEAKGEFGDRIGTKKRIGIVLRLLACHGRTSASVRDKDKGKKIGRR